MDQNQRPQYYEGQYLGADDLAAIVRFARTTEARHALGAHTWGIGIGLELVERPLPGGDVEMTLTPGFAFDGVGRQLVALAPAKLTPDLFDGFDDAVDPAGTPLEAWIAYHELSARHPGEGFASCREDAPFSRVVEGYRVEIRRPPGSEYRGVTIAGRVLDVKAAVSAFKPGGAPLYDETVAYQELPDQGDKPRWALFVGIVRWLKPVNLAGRMLKRTDDDVNTTRRRRRYLGAVAETIAAPDGVLRVRDRRKDPDDSVLNFQAPVVKPAAGVTPDNDLVWIEGGMRVIGDTRLVAGKLDYRVERGGNDGVPVWLRRVKDTTTPSAKVTLEAALGAPALPNGQTRFAVSELAPAGTSAERFTVVTDGRVGVNTPDPTNTLHVTGPAGIRHGPGYVSGDTTWTGLSLHAYFKSGDKWQFPDPLRKAAVIRLEENAGVPVISMSTNVLADPAKWVARLVIRGDTGNVGIGTATPAFKLDVSGNLHVTGDAYKDTAGLFWLVSDRALKDDIRPLTSALSTLLRLHGVEFSWRDPDRHGVSPGRYPGFVAQDVEKVLPQWVKTAPTGDKVLNPIGLDALLVEAIRELSERCERLEAALDAKERSAAAPRAAKRAPPRPKK